jgi:excisionase family DNA binding protein
VRGTGLVYFPDPPAGVRPVRCRSLKIMAADLGSTSELLTVAEAARMLRISATGMRRLQQERTVPFIRIRKAVRFLRRDLIAYLERQRVTSVVD